MRHGVYLLVLLFFCLLSPAANGQQVISSAGASATGVGVQLSWTLGEPVIETFTGTSAILTQGFHQSKLTVTAIDPKLYPELELSVYPNPVSSSLRLQITGERPGKLTYSLYNAEGKALVQKSVESFPETINMELFTSGSYFLKVFRDINMPVKTFKIIKE